MRFSRSGILVSCALLCALFACVGDSLAPFDPEVSAVPDNFQLQATDVQSVSASLDYPWRHTGTTANVNHSTTTSSGMARLVIMAADGTVVYARQLVPSRNEPTEPGPPGDWTIRLILDDYSGTLNFRAQRR